LPAHVEDAERWVVEVSLTAAWKESPALGCHPGDCHYLKVIQIEIVEQVRKLGPSPYRTQE